MFLLFCVTDLPRVEEKNDDSVGFCKNVWCDRCRIIPETCKMDFCYVFTGNTESYWIINCDHEHGTSSQVVKVIFSILL